MKAGVLKILDKDYGVYVRAIAALSVMFGHITVAYPWYIQRLFPGELWVGVFFFFSGYGLYKSLRCNPNYLQGFIRKKLKTIYLPFLLAETCNTLIYLLSKGCFSWKFFFIGAIGLHLYNTVAWYVVELLVINLLFYLLCWYTNRFRTIKIIWCWIGLFIVFLSFAVVSDIGTWWYISTSTFILGIAAVKYELKFIAIVTSRWSKLLPIIFVLGFALLCYLSHGQLGNKIIPINYLITAVTMLLVPMFVMSCAVVSQHIRTTMGGGVLLVLNKIGIASYEIYLWHMPFFTLGGFLISNSFLRIIFTVICTLLTAFILKYNKIIR